MNITEIRKKYSFFLFPLFLSSFLLFFPVVSFAFAVNLTSFVDLLLSSFYILIPILNGLALLLFFYGMAKFILAAGNQKDMADGKQDMIYGVLALFILVSFWGIMNFLSVQFGFGSANAFPTLPTNGNVESVTTTFTIDPNQSGIK